MLNALVLLLFIEKKKHGKFLSITPKLGSLPITQTGDAQVGHLQEFLHGKGCQTLEWAAQGGVGVPIPKSVQGITGGGTQCSALVEKVATGWT